MESNKTSPDYFDARGISLEDYADYVPPMYLQNLLDPELKILDFGCGTGQLLRYLQRMNYSQLYGVDILPAHINSLKSAGIKGKSISHFTELKDEDFQDFDLIVMSHVLEHFPKKDVVAVLKYIRENLLSSKGNLLIMVPNGQSPNGSYWAYEDFTHHTLFTAGSLIHVCKLAGFKTIHFLDPNCTETGSFLKRVLRTLLLALYKFKIRLWNFATDSHFHKPSPQIFSYELKALIRS
jgi:SAM-dependent methyltransferase